MQLTDETLMLECLELAKQAFGATRSNPMVGALLVHNGEIVSRGYHQHYGEAHAEVNAISALANKEILAHTKLVVNLEPCCHFGKTGPCADLVIASGIKQIVIGALDPNPLVAGKGINKLKDAGCQVKVGVLEVECRELNKRFYTFHQKQRPWTMLKWAQTQDGFIAKSNSQQEWISSQSARTLVHRWRSEEMAILIGANTARIDNPQLTVRLTEGQSPLRIVLDKELSLPASLNVFDGTAKTLLFSERSVPSDGAREVVTLPFDNLLVNSISRELHARKIVSLIVEGGTKTLQRWIDSNLWDEARIFVSPKTFGQGIRAPKLEGPTQVSQVDTDRLLVMKNSTV